MACQCSTQETTQESLVLEIIEANKDRPGPLIPILDEVQSNLGWLPSWALVSIARGLDMPVADVYGVVSFYSFFKLMPPGRTKIQVCLGTACYVRGAQILLEALERKLEITSGQTTADQRFTLEKVRCVGACSLAPVILTGETCHGGVDVTKLDKIINACDP